MVAQRLVPHEQAKVTTGRHLTADSPLRRASSAAIANTCSGGVMWSVAPASSCSGI